MSIDGSLARLHSFDVLLIQAEFVERWARLYDYGKEDRSDLNIGKLVTSERLLALFEWKNGGGISQRKEASVHLWSPDRFPIYDQHVHRAMVWIQARQGGVSSDDWCWRELV